MTQTGIVYSFLIVGFMWGSIANGESQAPSGTQGEPEKQETPAGAGKQETPGEPGKQEPPGEPGKQETPGEPGKHETPAGAGSQSPQELEDSLNEMKMLFSQMDVDGDQLISERDVEAVLKQQGMDAGNDNIKDIIKDADLNGDGSIDFAEFQTYMANRKNTETFFKTEDDFTDVFKIFDKDGDGFISREELRDTINGAVDAEEISEPGEDKNKEKVTDKELDEMFKQADIDMDGKISYQEFVRAMQSNNQIEDKIRKLTEGNSDDDFVSDDSSGYTTGETTTEELDESEDGGNRPKKDAKAEGSTQVKEKTPGTGEGGNGQEVKGAEPEKTESNTDGQKQ